MVGFLSYPYGSVPEFFCLCSVAFLNLFCTYNSLIQSVVRSRVLVYLVINLSIFIWAGVLPRAKMLVGLIEMKWPSTTLLVHLLWTAVYYPLSALQECHIFEQMNGHQLIDLPAFKSVNWIWNKFSHPDKIDLDQLLCRVWMGHFKWSFYLWFIIGFLRSEDLVFLHKVPDFPFHSCAWISICTHINEWCGCRGCSCWINLHSPVMV